MTNDAAGSVLFCSGVFLYIVLGMIVAMFYMYILHVSDIFMNIIQCTHKLSINTLD